jgi:STE24 endopeptidase
MDSPPGPSDRLNGRAPVAALLAVLAAVAVGFLAAWALGPGEPPVDTGIPSPDRQVSQIASDARAEAEDYRGSARPIAVAALAVEFALLAFFAFYRGRPMRRLLGLASRRPVLGAAAIGIGLSLVVSVAALPFSYLSFDLGRDYGLVTQDTSGWLGDRLIAAAVSAVIAAIIATAGFLAWRRFRGRFWIAAAGLAGGLAVIWIWVWPVAVAPLFNDFEPLPPGPARAAVLELADRAGVEVENVYSVDASRRSSALNAYVNGIGSSKRVVIYDNAIEQLPPRAFAALVAHELSHVESLDVYRGLAFALIVIPLAALALQLFASSALRSTGDEQDSPAVILPLALALAFMTLALTVPGNWLSRQVELRADYEAVSLTGDPQGIAALQRRIATSNLSDPDPPPAWQFLFGTHPSTAERLTLAEAMRREAGKE